MDYQMHYQRLVERAKSRIIDGYSERHHIVPKCLGGSNEADNIVRLTPEEHYVAHQLLVKIYPHEVKLAFAAAMMCSSVPQHQRANKLYGWVRRKFAEAQRTNPRKPRKKETKPRKKRTLSPEHRAKIGAAGLGRKHSEQTKAQIRAKCKATWAAKLHQA